MTPARRRIKAVPLARTNHINDHIPYPAGSVLAEVKKLLLDAERPLARALYGPGPGRFFAGGPPTARWRPLPIYWRSSQQGMRAGRCRVSAQCASGGQGPRERTCGRCFCNEQFRNVGPLLLAGSLKSDPASHRHHLPQRGRRPNFSIFARRYGRPTVRDNGVCRIPLSLPPSTPPSNDPALRGSAKARLAGCISI